MSCLCLDSIWGPGTDLIFACMYLQSPRADTEHSTFNSYTSSASPLTELGDPAIEHFPPH